MKKLIPFPKTVFWGEVVVFSKNILIYVFDDFHFFLRKLKRKTHLLDTLNIRVGLMKNFLETFEKKFSSKK